MNRYRFDSKRHIHYLDGKRLYGTSTVKKIIAGVPGNWYAGMSLKPLGWSPIQNKKEDRLKEVKKCLVKIEDMIINGDYNKDEYPHPFIDDCEWLQLLDKCYHNHATFTKEKAEEGTDAHSCMENHIRSILQGLECPTIDESIKDMVEWSKQNVKQWLWSELYVYSESLWTGGIIDAGFIHTDGSICLADFKNRDTVRFKDIVQCGGYVLQLEENSCGYDENGIQNMEIPMIEKIDKIYVFPLKDIKQTYCLNNTTNAKYMFKSALNLFKANEEFKK